MSIHKFDFLPILRLFWLLFAPWWKSPFTNVPLRAIARNLLIKAHYYTVDCVSSTQWRVRR